MAYDRSEHVIGIGKSIGFADTLAGSYTTISGTQDIQLPQRELGEAEITNDNSPDYHKDFIPALYDSGSVTFKYVYARSQFAAVETLFQLATVSTTRASATKFWKVTLPDASTATFKGFLKKHDLPIEGVEDVPVVECEIRVCGKMTFTAGT